MGEGLPEENTVKPNLEDNIAIQAVESLRSGLFKEAPPQQSDSISHPLAGMSAIAQILHVSKYPSVEEEKMLEEIWSEVIRIDNKRPISVVYDLLSQLGAPTFGVSKLEQLNKFIHLNKVSRNIVDHIYSSELEKNQVANRNSG